jgi:uncharacterized protein YkwD
VAGWGADPFPLLSEDPLRTTALSTALLAAVLALPVSAQAMPAGEKPHVRPRSNSWEARVLQLTNDRRRAHGVGPLKASKCADGFAESWTRHLARKQELVHQDLGPILKCPHTSSVGENIAYGYETPRQLVRAWMHSEGHRANILSSHFHRLGVAGWRSVNGVTYATQDFIG